MKDKIIIVGHIGKAQIELIDRLEKDNLEIVLVDSDFIEKNKLSIPEGNKYIIKEVPMFDELIVADNKQQGYKGYYNSKRKKFRNR